MNTRTVALSICASVMGTIIANVLAGSVATADIQANPVFRNSEITPGAESMSRHIYERLYERQSAAFSSSSSVSVEAPKADTTVCDTAKAVLTDIAVSEQQSVLDEGILQALTDARESIEAKYCVTVSVSSSSSSSSSVAPESPVVDLNCERFAEGSARHVSCVIDEGTLNE